MGIFPSQHVLLANKKLLSFMGLWKTPRKPNHHKQVMHTERWCCQCWVMPNMPALLKCFSRLSEFFFFFPSFHTLPPHAVFFIFHPTDQYCSAHEGCCPSRSIYAITKRIIMDLICLNAGRTGGGGSVATKFGSIKNSEGLLCCLLPSGKMTQSCASSITHSAPWAGQAPCRWSLSNIRS